LENTLREWSRAWRTCEGGEGEVTWVGGWSPAIEKAKSSSHGLTRIGSCSGETVALDPKASPATEPPVRRNLVGTLQHSVNTAGEFVHPKLSVGVQSR